MKRPAGILALCFAMSSLAAHALEAPKLPAAAKKLSGKEIAALYDGSTVTFNNFTKSKSITGTVTYDLKKKTEAGTFVYGNNSGDFTGVIRIAGDKFCFAAESQKEQCVSVYTEGSNIYEVDGKGIVASVNQKK